MIGWLRAAGRAHNFVKGVTRNTMRGGKTDPFYLATALGESKAPGWMTSAAGVGTFTGMTSAVGGEFFRGTVGKVPGLLNKGKVPIANIAAIGATYAAGSSLANDLYGAYQGGTGRKNQQRAIAEQFAYNANPQVAGFGAPMRFAGGGGYASAVPSQTFAQGYSPKALGATGDLVMALHSIARR